MKGWGGAILTVDLSGSKVVKEKLDKILASDFIGGRGLAVKLLWDHNPKGVNPLSPLNNLVFSIGPLTGLSLPSSGKMTVASKSPLTFGYGDGNLGSLAAVQMKKNGLDAVIFSGKSEKPTYVVVEDGAATLLDAGDLWGLKTFDAEKRLQETYGKDAGILSIGPAGENLVYYANIISQEGRAGGRPGIGAVMGSKNLKAVVLKGRSLAPADNPEKLRSLGAEAYQELLEKPNYPMWKRQGTISTIAWSQENEVLPTFNYKEGIFNDADKIGGDAMETLKISQKGCPNCNIRCGNVVGDADEKESELDYENVAMLGSNIGLGDLKKVSALNRMADEYGVDTISLGNSIAFAIESGEKGVLKERIEWGDFDAIKALTEDIVYKRGLGETLSLGVKAASETLQHNSQTWAMHIKGLEVSAYNCHSTPGMALAYATSPIGAHHKDAWIIAWEVTTSRKDYGEKKVDKVIELQRIRGGLFEILTTCRFPWVELSLELDWYPKLFEAATGVKMSFNDFHRVSDRIYALIRAFWVREYGSAWSNIHDFPPLRWFTEPPQQGNLKGSTLSRERFANMLQMYYQKRGWSQQGIPTRETLEMLNLQYAASEIYTM